MPHTLTTTNTNMCGICFLSEIFTGCLNQNFNMKTKISFIVEEKPFSDLHYFKKHQDSTVNEQGYGKF